MSLQDIIKCTDLLAEKDAIIAELQDELSDYWWYALQKESGDKGEGWISPYMSEGEYAGPKRRGRGEPLRDGRAVITRLIAGKVMR